MVIRHGRRRGTTECNGRVFLGAITLVVALALALAVTPAAAIAAPVRDGRLTSAQSQALRLRKHGTALPSALRLAGAVRTADSLDTGIPATDDGVIENAATMTVGTWCVLWDFATDQDRDWRSFEASGGNTYEVTVRNSNPANDVDPYVSLYFWDGVTPGADLWLMAADDRLVWDGSGNRDVDSDLFWTCPVSDKYYLQVENYGTNAGPYDIQVQNLGSLTRPVATRMGAGDRYKVARQVALAAAGGSWAGIDTVILASGLDRSAADALAASGLAGLKDAPILLVNQDSRTRTLPYATLAAIKSIESANPGVAVKYYVLGGKVSTPDWVITRTKYASTAARNARFERLYGADRYACAARIAREIRSEAPGEGETTPTACFVANGQSTAYFFDALAAAPYAYDRHWPILLCGKWTMPGATRTEEGASGGNYVNTYVVGDGAEMSPYCVSTLGGTRIGDAAEAYYYRSEIARKVAEWANYNISGSRTDFCVANKLPDALTGGTLAGSRPGGPCAMLLSQDWDFADLTTLDYIQQCRMTIANYYLIGGTASISTWQGMEIGYNAGATYP